MWLKEAIEKRHIDYLLRYYSRADKRFRLKQGIQSYPSYLNANRFHLAGYVKKSYSVNGTTYLELETSNSETVTITAPQYTNAKDLEFETVLCENIVEHFGILDNVVYQRDCSKITVL